MIIISVAAMCNESNYSHCLNAFIHVLVQSHEIQVESNRAERSGR